MQCDHAPTQATAIMMDRLHSVSFRLCLLVGLACAVVSAYFCFFASYETVVAAIVASGFAIGFASIAAVISSDEGGKTQSNAPSRRSEASQ